MSRGVFATALYGVLTGFMLLALTGITECSATCVEYDEAGTRIEYACKVCQDNGADECRSERWDFPGDGACTVDNQPKEPDGTACENGAGMCMAGQCVVDIVCGDGVIAGDEVCDDGTNNGGGDGFCLADCSGTQVCGDGTVNGSEFCEATDMVDCSTLGFVGGTAACDSACAAWDESTCTMLSDCGNGVLDPGEVCDDGMNMGGEGGCLTCTSIQECGDGMPEGTESCDDGILNGTGNGQCLDDCSATQSCGDETVNGTEVCDDGILNGTGNDACLSDCSGTQACGDGSANGTEACDDGVDNGTGEGFCLSDCSATQTCGDGVQNGSEFCESGDSEMCTALSAGFVGGSAPCDSACAAWDVSGCTTPDDCGNGVVDPGESCDDVDNDGGEGECLACMGIQSCGDGTSEGSEACDEGGANGSGPGACVGDCSGFQVCGDGVTNGTEVCDDGTNDGGPNGCLPDCLAVQMCGDGVANGTESCDDGPNNGMGDGLCLSDCSATQTCGDMVVNGTEVCDVGDTALCTSLDAAFLGGTALCDVTTCAGWELSTCTTPADCGNGIVDDGEVCDDGSNVGGEGGCVACGVVQVCGDGVQNGTEQCDDGNTANSDGCDADCTVGFIACDITSSNCPTGTSCYPTGTEIFGNGDFCLTVGTLPEGASCGPPNACQAGLGCVPTVTGKRCSALCDETLPCADGDVCVSQAYPSALSACTIEVCDIFVQDCPSGQGCYPVSIGFAGQTYTGDFCYPAGTGTAGTACNNGWLDCAPGLGCVTTNGENPLCQPICDLTNPVCAPGTTCTMTDNPDIGYCQVDTP